MKVKILESRMGEASEKFEEKLNDLIRSMQTEGLSILDIKFSDASFETTRLKCAYIIYEEVVETIEVNSS